MAGVRQHYTAEVMAERALDVYTRLVAGEVERTAAAS